MEFWVVQNFSSHVTELGVSIFRSNDELAPIMCMVSPMHTLQLKSGENRVPSVARVAASIYTSASDEGKNCANSAIVAHRFDIRMLKTLSIISSSSFCLNIFLVSIVISGLSHQSFGLGLSICRFSLLVTIPSKNLHLVAPGY